MRVTVALLALFVALFAAAMIVGVVLPAAYVVSRSVRFEQQPEVVWGVISDFAASSSWREDLQEVRQLPDKNGHPVWRETYKNGVVLTLEMIESDAPRRLARRIINSDLQSEGTWEFDIVASDGGSQLTITESGETHNPILRVIRRFLVGHRAVIDGYLRSLGKKLGEEVRPGG